MPLGTEHALVLGVSAGAIALGAVFAGLWWNLDAPAVVDATGTIVSPAPFDAPPFCEHRIGNGTAGDQVIVRVSPLKEYPPPPSEGIKVEVQRGNTHVSQGLTDIFGCTSVSVPRAGSYVFSASVQESDRNATHQWWSNAVTQHYDGDPPDFVDLRLHNYARYG